MVRKLKWIMLALLGFSTACSTVRNAPAKGGEGQKADTAAVRTHPRIVAMYGVRAPEPLPQSRQRMERMEQDTLTPVLEVPADDMPEKTAPKR